MAGDVRRVSYNTIINERCGTNGHQSGTNWYDQAHSETVLEYLDFDYSDDTLWYCIEGGAQQLAFNMADKLKNKSSIAFGSRVTGIDASTRNDVKIQLNGEWQGAYTGVFNSTTLGCMQQMDLTKAGLNYGQKQAIRSLGYGASAKVGMKFSQPWWRNIFGIIEGGLGHSDLRIRTTVYPSYNLYDPTDGSAVLLCSYEWQQDAQRISTLISSSSDHQKAVQEELPLKELVLRDLALLHSGQPGTNLTPQEVYDKIAPLYEDHYAHDWYHDANTYGAFAFFRPQQFGSMWPYIIAPSPSVVIIGEHASNHHAWVVGALESAVHGVHGWLAQNNFPGAQAAAKVMESWGAPTNENPFGGLPTFVSARHRGWQTWFGLIHDEKFRNSLQTGKQAGKAERIAVQP
jgi:monoamine oxidase